MVYSVFTSTTISRHTENSHSMYRRTRKVQSRLLNGQRINCIQDQRVKLHTHSEDWLISIQHTNHHGRRWRSIYSFAYRYIFAVLQATRVLSHDVLFFTTPRHLPPPLPFPILITIIPCFLFCLTRQTHAVVPFNINLVIKANPNYIQQRSQFHHDDRRRPTKDLFCRRQSI